MNAAAKPAPIDVLAMLSLAKAVALQSGLQGDARDYERASEAVSELIDAARSGAVCAEDLRDGIAARNAQEQAAAGITAKRIREAIAQAGAA